MCTISMHGLLLFDCCISVCCQDGAPINILSKCHITKRHFGSYIVIALSFISVTSTNRHRWLHYICDQTPVQQPLELKKFLKPHEPNPTATEGEYIPYSTTRPKIESWHPPKVSLNWFEVMVSIQYKASVFIYKLLLACAICCVSFEVRNVVSEAYHHLIKNFVSCDLKMGFKKMKFRSMINFKHGLFENTYSWKPSALPLSGSAVWWTCTLLCVTVRYFHINFILQQFAWC